MESKPRLFIYDRREMIVLILLSVMVALFAFTLGVHLGKRVPGTTQGASEAPPAKPVLTEPDALPNRQDLTEQAEAADPAAAEVLDRSLHEEVARTGIQLEKPRPTSLPRQTKSQTESRARDSEVKSAPKARSGNPAEVALRRESPPGRYTLQVGSFPNVDEAAPQVESLEAIGLKPFVRGVDISGKGRWYRVFIGGYPSREEAQKSGQRYAAEQMIESFLVANMIE